MNQSEFESKMLRAKTMHDLDKPDYWDGYMRGLRRFYHGENFGTADEHEKWMSLTGPDETRAERGRGYRDGLASEETSKAAAALGRKGGASKSEIKKIASRLNGLQPPRLGRKRGHPKK
jgi:hypothetical protein